MDTLSPVLLVRVDDDLRVTQGPEVVSPALELTPQLPEIIDLAVEDDGLAAIFTEDGLAAARQINDAQATASQSNGPAKVERLFVRSPMGQDGHHALQLTAVGETGAVSEEDAGDTAHRVVLRSVRDPGEMA